jgi:type I restriction enzyme S subunit
MSVEQLITAHLDIWTAAVSEKKSGRGRSSGSTGSVYGIKKLRELILELAVRGKLVPQDESDEPASELLKRIAAEKAKLVAEGKIKKSKPLAEITDDEKPFELPTGWEWAKLGEITNFGITEKLGFISDETWVLDLEDIEKDTSRLLNKKSFCDRRSLSDKNSFQEGDVLYGKLRPYLNKVIVADESGVCTTEIFPIRCYGSFSSHYFKYALKSPYFINYVNARSYGMKMPRLGTEDGRKANFPLPPLAEQHRIVAKVDELMALCDQLENQHNDAAEAHEKLVTHLLGTLTQSQNAEDFNTNWQRISEHFDTLFTTEASIDALKQTLLQLAVMGKLVPQDLNDEPARELLKRIQAEKAKLIVEGKIKKEKPLATMSDEEKPFDLPVGWKWVFLPDVSEYKVGKTPSTKSSVYWTTSGDGFNWVSIADLNHDGSVFETTKQITDKAVSEVFRYEPAPVGTILMSFKLTLGKISTLEVPAFHNEAIISIYPNQSIFKDYLFKVLPARAMAGNSKSAIKGNTLNSESIAALMIPLPPIEEQYRIVVKVDELMAICDQLKARINSSNQLQQKLADVMIDKTVN